MCPTKNVVKYAGKKIYLDNLNIMDTIHNFALFYILNV